MAEQVRDDFRLSRMPTEVEFIWQSAISDYQLGVADHPTTWKSFKQQYGSAGWAPIPSFCTIQATGKKRRIDDARRGGHNLATAQNERQTLTSAMQPATHTKLLFEHADLAGKPHPAVHTGVVDLPNAFRSLPCYHKHLQYKRGFT